MARAGLKRGDLIIGSAAGDYGMPRPNIVVQSDLLGDLESILVCPLTSDLATAGPTRLLIRAAPENGLVVDSLAMVDKITAISRSRIRDRIGQLSADELASLDPILILVMGLLDPAAASPAP